jgi:hypothetical protein
MLARTPLSAFFGVQTNSAATPNATPGTAVTPGASGSEGAWTSIIAATARESAWVYLRVSDGATASNSKQHLLDLGIDPTGGTSYTPLFEDLVCGCSAPLTVGGGFQFLFPLRIPAGARVGVRIQGLAATAGSVRVDLRLYGNACAPPFIPSAQYVERIGATSGTVGVSFTPGNAADGTWTLLGTTTRPCWWWQLGYSINNGTITAEYTWIELGYGDGTAGGTTSILRLLHGGTTNEVCNVTQNGNLSLAEAFAEVPEGTNIYVRGRCTNAPDTGYHAVALGFGG